MIVQLKNELARVAQVVGAEFSCRSNPELQDFAQQFDFTIKPLINLLPIKTYNQNIIASGAIRYDFRFELYFLTIFRKSDTLEMNKDILIDGMSDLSEKFFSTLNKNEALYFINPQWSWSNEIIRQYLSNLACGVHATINIDTACNRIPTDGVFDYSLDAPMN